MNIVEWRDKVCEAMKEGIKRAETTGSDKEPTAIASFSVEFLQSFIDQAPSLDGLR
jgi:hypothetical protein